jgi:hypothetical protein
MHSDGSDPGLGSVTRIRDSEPVRQRLRGPGPAGPARPAATGHGRPPRLGRLRPRAHGWAAGAGPGWLRGRRGVAGGRPAWTPGLLALLRSDLSAARCRAATAQETRRAAQPDRTARPRRRAGGFGPGHRPEGRTGRQRTGPGESAPTRSGPLQVPGPALRPPACRRAGAAWARADGGRRRLRTRRPSGSAGSAPSRTAAAPPPNLKSAIDRGPIFGSAPGPGRVAHHPGPRSAGS